MGFLVGFLDALLSAFQNTQFRKLPETSPVVLNWLRWSGGTFVIALLLTVFSQWKIPHEGLFWLYVAASVGLESALGFLYVRAFQLSSQSLVGPLFALSSVVLILPGIFLLGQTPTLWGVVGILIVVGGSFLLGWDIRDPGMRGAILRIFKERGSRHMLVAVAVAGGTVPLAVLSFQFTTPLFFALCVTAGLTLVHTPLALSRPFTGFAGKKRFAALMVLAYALKTTLHYVGLNLLFAAYYISVKRLAVVFDVVFGRTLGGEKEEFPRRLIASLIMFAGVALMALAG